MDLLEGQSLKQFIRGEPLDYNQALSLALQICNAMEYAHSQGVLHRDLNANNVMIIKDNDAASAKIIDFGLSKTFDADFFNGVETMTPSGRIAGTPSYMSPEQCRGEALSKSSDIYSFGCLLFEMLAGKAPFEGSNALETMHMQVNAELPSLARASSSTAFKKIQKIIEKCLSKQKENRYQTFSELQNELSKLEPFEESQRPGKNLNPKLNIWVAGALSSIVLLLVTAGTFLFKQKPDILNQYTKTEAETDTSKMTWHQLNSLCKQLKDRGNGDEIEKHIAKWLDSHHNRVQIETINDVDVYAATFGRKMFYHLFATRKTGVQRSLKSADDYREFLHKLMLSAAFQNDDAKAFNAELSSFSQITKAELNAGHLDFVLTYLRMCNELLVFDHVEDANRAFGLIRDDFRELCRTRRIISLDLVYLEKLFRSYEDVCMAQLNLDNALAVSDLREEIANAYPPSEDRDFVMEDILYRRAYIEQFRKQAAKAIECFNQAEKLDQKWNKNGWLLLRSRLVASAALKKNKEFEESFNLLKCKSCKLPSDFPLVDQDLKNTALQLSNAGKHEAAEWCYRERMEIEKMYSSKRRWDYSTEVATELEKQGKIAEADKLYESDTEGLKQILKTDDERVLYIVQMHRLVENEMRLGQLQNCHKYLDKAFEMYNSIKAPVYKNTLEYALIVADAGMLAKIEKRDDKASELFLEAARIHKQRTGNNQASVAAYLQVAEIYARANDKKNAEKYIEIGAKMLGQIAPVADVPFVDVRDRLAVSYLFLNEFTKSLDSFKQAARAFAKMSSTNAPEQKINAYRSCIFTLHTILGAANSPERARSLKETLIELRKDLSRESSGIPRTLNLIFACYAASADRIDKNPGTAQIQHKQVLEQCKQMQADERDLCVSCLQFELGIDALAMNNPREAIRSFEDCKRNSTGAIAGFYHDAAVNQLASLKARNP